MTTQSAATPSNAAAEQHAALGLDTDKRSRHTTHPEAQWFEEAGLGLFVHWGLASTHGNIDLSWGMMANTPWDSTLANSNKVTPEEYWKLADRFKPDRYDPERWISAAARAGFQYAVFTAMHHDGYTLWPSRHSEIGVQSHLQSRDLVGPFVEACRKYKLKVGIYYSPPDWYFDREFMSYNYQSFSFKADQHGITPPAKAPFDTHHRPAPLRPFPPQHVQKRRERFHARVEELLTRYGRIDLLWFDGGTHDNAIRDRIRELQPHIVINSRALDGDYDCTECTLPTKRPVGWFETCGCWQSTNILHPSGSLVDVWGYLSPEEYKSSGWMLSQLSQLRAWGANLLINVGPRPNGELPDIVYRRFDEVGQWMSHSGHAVIGARPIPPNMTANVPATRNTGSVFLHLLPENKTGPAILHTTARPRSVRLLRTGQPLDFSFDGSSVQITVPASLRTELVDVIAIR